MTKTDARQILGISRSAGLKSAERAYRQQQQVLRIRMVPGNPRSDRQRAQSELTELTAAWKSLQTKQPKETRPVKQHKPAPPQSRHICIEDVVQNFFETWDILVEMAPFPKFVTKLFLIVWFLLVITVLCMRSAKGV